MKRSLPLLLLTIAILGFVGIGFYLYTQTQKEENDNGQGEETTKQEETSEDNDTQEESSPEVELKNVLIVIAPANYHDEEYKDTRAAIENANLQVTVASKDTSTATGLLGGNVNIDIELSQVETSNYKAIIFIGGPGAHDYFEDEDALRLALGFYLEGKVVAAICSAPTILANAEILAGKKATCFPGYESNLTSKGATYTAEAVTVDGLIVTGNGPEAAKAFGEKVVEIIETN